MGGVHPPENKIAEKAAIEILPAPKQLFIPISQHLGAPAVPVVEKGAKVKAGQLLAKGEAFISANIHTPASGTVNKIDDYIDSSGYKRRCIFLDVEGAEWLEGIDTTAALKNDITMAPEDIVKKLQECGVVGLGGATFPSHVKYMLPQGKKADYLIINAVECEPYLTSDHRLMLEKGDEVLIGVTILMKALKVDKAFIGIENNKADAIAHLTQLASKYKGIEVYALKVKYPQGAEKQLIKALVGREVPSGKLPIDVGCVVNNVGTAFAAYEAVQKNKPLVERVVTVTGKSVKKPSNFMVKIGTPVSLLIEKAGGLPEDTGKIVNGGPMMGKAITSTEVPVTKGTSGILIITKQEANRVPEVNCIRCAKCVFVCPMGLSPYLIANVAEKQDYEYVERERVMDCIECGSCHYTCPSGRALLDYIRLGKTKVGQIIRNRAK